MFVIICYFMMEFWYSNYFISVYVDESFEQFWTELLPFFHYTPQALLFIILPKPFFHYTPHLLGKTARPFIRRSWGAQNHHPIAGVPRSNLTRGDNRHGKIVNPIWVKTPWKYTNRFQHQQHPFGKILPAVHYYQQYIFEKGKYYH